MPNFPLGPPRPHRYSVSIGLAPVTEYFFPPAAEIYWKDGPPPSPFTLSTRDSYCQWSATIGNMVGAVCQRFWVSDDTGEIAPNPQPNWTWFPTAGYLYDTEGNPRQFIPACVWTRITWRTELSFTEKYRIILSYPNATGAQTLQTQTLVSGSTGTLALAFSAQELLTLNPETASHARRAVGQATASFGALSASFPLRDADAANIGIIVGATNAGGSATVDSYGPMGAALRSTGQDFLTARMDSPQTTYTHTESEDGKTGTVNLVHYAPTSSPNPLYRPDHCADNPNIWDYNTNPNYTYQGSLYNVIVTSRPAPFQKAQPGLNEGLDTSVLFCYPVTRLSVIARARAWPTDAPIVGLPVRVRLDNPSGAGTDNQPPVGIQNTGADGTATFATGPNASMTAANGGVAKFGAGVLQVQADANWLDDYAKSPKPAPRPPNWAVTRDSIGGVQPITKPSLATFRRARTRIVLAGQDAALWTAFAVPKAKYSVAVQPEPPQIVTYGSYPNEKTYTPPFDRTEARRVLIAQDAAAVRLAAPSAASSGFVYGAWRKLDGSSAEMGKRRAFRNFRWLRVRLTATKACALTLVLQSYSGVKTISNVLGTTTTLIVPTTVSFPLSLAAGDNSLLLDMARGPDAPFAPKTDTTGFVPAWNRADSEAVFGKSPLSPIFDQLGEWSVTGARPDAEEDAIWDHHNVWYARLDGLPTDGEIGVQELRLEDREDTGRTVLRVLSDPPPSDVSNATPPPRLLLRTLVHGRPIAGMPYGGGGFNGANTGTLDELLARWRGLIDGGSGAWTLTRTGDDVEGALAADLMAPASVNADGFDLDLRPRVGLFSFAPGFDVLVSPSVTAYFDLGGQIEGIVFDSSTRAPLAARRLSSSRQYPDTGPVQPEGTATTDADGYFALGGLFQANNSAPHTVTVADEAGNLAQPLLAPHRNPVHYYVLARLAGKGGGAVEIDSVRQWIHVATGKRILTCDAVSLTLLSTSPEHNVDGWLKMRANPRGGDLALLGRRGANAVVFRSADGGMTLTEVTTMAATSTLIEWDSERDALCLLTQDGTNPVTLRQSIGGAAFSAPVTVQVDGTPLSATLVDITRDARRGVFVIACTVGSETRLYQSADLAEKWARIL